MLLVLGLFVLALAALVNAKHGTFIGPLLINIDGNFAARDGRGLVLKVHWHHLALALRPLHLKLRLLVGKLMAFVL